MLEVLVVGGGPAGMMAAGQCDPRRARVTLMEKNEKLGKKLLITGKGRCNFSNDAPLEQFIANMPGNGPFLFSALNAFSSRDLQDFFRQRGVAVKRERGGRLFPESDRSSDILAALEDFLKERGVALRFRQRAQKILLEEGRAAGVLTEAGKVYRADRVILAVGGASYPGTGSTGDGYSLAGEAGHTILSPRPGLVPLRMAEGWVTDLQGLALKNVELSFKARRGAVEGEFGELLFTHFGLSGPIVLSLSRRMLGQREGLTLRLNLKPALAEETLLKRVQRDLDKNSRKQYQNCLEGLLPKKLIPVVVSLSGIDPDKQAAHINREERLALTRLLQNLPLTFRGFRPLAEAIVTVGGVSVKEVNPKTMESKKVPGLYLCGEVLDVDGYTGGYNLQAAFSTGYVAGKRAAEA